MDVVKDVETRVNWWVVIGGILLAVVTGIFVGLFFIFVGGSMFDKPTPVIVSAVAATFLFYFAMSALARRWITRDLAMGLLIGGCMVALGTGACGWLITGLSMH